MRNCAVGVCRRPVYGMMVSLGAILMLMATIYCPVEGKRAKKYIGENGGDFEFIDEVSAMCNFKDTWNWPKSNWTIVSMTSLVRVLWCGSWGRYSIIDTILILPRNTGHIHFNTNISWKMILPSFRHSLENMSSKDSVICIHLLFFWHLLCLNLSYTDEWIMLGWIARIFRYGNLTNEWWCLARQAISGRRFLNNDTLQHFHFLFVQEHRVRFSWECVDGGRGNV